MTGFETIMEKEPDWKYDYYVSAYNIFQTKELAEAWAVSMENKTDNFSHHVIREIDLEKRPPEFGYDVTDIDLSF